MADAFALFSDVLAFVSEFFAAVAAALALFLAVWAVDALLAALFAEFFAFVSEFFAAVALSSALSAAVSARLMASSS